MRKGSSGRAPEQGREAAAQRGQAERRRAPAKAGADRIGRREFLRRGAVAGLGLGLLPLAPPAAADPPEVRRRVRLGRTGLRVPDIGFGTASLRGDVELVRHALDRGISYFDTAESYTNGDAERTLGQALAGDRERVVLASKVIARASASRQQLMRALEGSLRRLRTETIDIYFNHAVNDLDRLLNPEWREFAARAKAQGKIRFTGVSGHGGRLVECLDRALDEDLVDVILAAHNFGQDERFWERWTKGADFVARQPDLPRVLARARQQDVGVIAMKTLMGARLNDLRPYETDGSSFAQAAFRWVLSQPDTDALVVTMRSRERVDEYLGASGWTRPRRADLPLLAAYLERNGSSQCRQGCGACLDSCPNGVPIPDVLRTRMYAEDYGEPQRARSEYASLGEPAAPCLSCAERSCAGACPHGLAIASLTAPTHRRLAAPGAPARETILS